MGLLKQLKKIFKLNKLLLTTSYDGQIDNINNDTFRDAAEKVDFVHISVYDYDSLDYQYNNCQSHASNISSHLSDVNSWEMTWKSIHIPYYKHVDLRKIVFEQRFMSFDMNVPLRRCTPLNYNQICGIINERQSEWNISYPRNYHDWFEATNQNNTRALVFESKNWLVFETIFTVVACDYRPNGFGGFIINLDTDDYSGKCNFKEYPYYKTEYPYINNYTLQVPNNPTFPLLKTIRSAIETYFKAKDERFRIRPKI